MLLNGHMFTRLNIDKRVIHMKYSIKRRKRLQVYLISLHMTTYKYFYNSTYQ